jgi:hypothetical protein
MISTRASKRSNGAQDALKRQERPSRVVYPIWPGRCLHRSRRMHRFLQSSTGFYAGSWARQPRRLPLESGRSSTRGLGRDFSLHLNQCGSLNRRMESGTGVSAARIWVTRLASSSMPIHLSLRTSFLSSWGSSALAGECLSIKLTLVGISPLRYSPLMWSSRRGSIPAARRDYETRQRFAVQIGT